MTCDIIRGKRRYDQFWKYFGDEEFHFGHNDISNLRKKICRQLNTMKQTVERAAGGSVCAGDCGRDGVSSGDVLVHSGGGVYTLSHPDGVAKEPQ